jgi:hypothetical protein
LHPVSRVSMSHAPLKCSTGFMLPMQADGAASCLYWWVGGGLVGGEGGCILGLHGLNVPCPMPQVFHVR